MIWTKRLILALILFSVASPALAGIDRFTDDRGILHITNTSKEKARFDERDEDVSSPPRNLPRTPPTVKSSPPPPEADQPQPAEIEKEEPKPSSYLTVHKGVIHITNLSSKAVETAKTQPTPAPEPVAAAETPAAPVLPVALARSAAPPAPPLQTSRLPSTSVKTYTDNKGVIHVTNSLPARPPVGDILVAGWSSRPPKASEEVAEASKDMGTILARKPEPLEALPIRKASWLPGAPLGGLPVMPVAVSGSSFRSGKVAKAKVRRFKDAKGVLHIVGQGPAPKEPSVAPPDRMITSAGLPPVASGPLYPRLPRPSLPAWPETTVSLRRDQQGRLVIQNAPRGRATNGNKEDARGQLAPVLMEAAYRFGLPVSLIEAVIKVESNFQPAAVSPKGAMGLMQLMPGTARFLGVSDAFCPRENVLGGTRYLRLLLDFFGQSLPLALAAYNAGFQRVIDAGWRVPEIKETQDFVAKVMGHYYLQEKQYAAQRLLL